MPVIKFKTELKQLQSTFPVNMLLSSLLFREWCRSILHRDNVLCQSVSDIHQIVFPVAMPSAVEGWIMVKHRSVRQGATHIEGETDFNTAIAVFVTEAQQKYHLQMLVG